MPNLFFILLVSKNPPYIHSSVKTVLHAFIHNLFTVGQWCSHSCVVCMHKSIRCEMESWQTHEMLVYINDRTAVFQLEKSCSIHNIHIKTATQAPTRALTQLQSAPGLCFACREQPVTPATCLKWLKKSTLEKQGFSKGQK